MLHAVLFDLDNTLVDRDRAFREEVAATFADDAVRDRLLHLDAGGRGDRAPLLAAWNRHAGAPRTLAELGGAIAGRLQPDAGLLAVLRELATRVQLGIISNGGGDIQRRKIAAAGLGRVFPRDRVWISGELGLAKPDPGIFHEAVRHLGTAPEHCLHVGDHDQHDLAGATAAGLRARLVNGALDGRRLAGLLAEEGLL